MGATSRSSRQKSLGKFCWRTGIPWTVQQSFGSATNGLSPMVRTMNPITGLFRAIHANPEDRELRAVLADALEEAGFIRQARAHRALANGWRKTYATYVGGRVIRCQVGPIYTPEGIMAVLAKYHMPSRRRWESRRFLRRLEPPFSVEERGKP